MISMKPIIPLLALGLVSLSESYTPVSRGCEERSCYPATGNLLIGRQDKLEATSTCGLERRERYCILSHLEYSRRDQKCFWCDSTDQGVEQNPQTSHRIENLVYRMEPPDAEPARQYRTWWQAQNGVENVTIQLDLEAEFHVTHLIITFKTFRPAAMYIEKSYDWGQTWKIHRYFAYDCARSFPGIYEGAPRYLNETVCQRRYSRLTPTTFGSVIYRVLPPNINIHSPGFNPYSKEVQDLLKTTNLRIHMTKLHTLGDENLETERLDIKAIMGMVHGKCDCTHNTKGNNCEYCLDDYNDVPWQPATGKKKNECKKCNCNDHASSCYFNQYVYAATGNVSGGVCNNCSHNTDGIHCEYCKEGFFQVPELELNDPNICEQCDCEPDGTIDGGLCDGRTDPEEGLLAGQCHCKTNVGGERCDRCMNGFWNFTLDNPDGCQECKCMLEGIVSNDGCDQVTGDCTCKRFVVGRDCDQCMPQHYGLSMDDPNGCKACDCDIGGSYDNNCDVMTGQCKCRPNIGGRRCDTVDDGYYSGGLDFLLFEGELAFGSQNPPTKVIRKEPSSRPEDNTWTGFGYMQVYEGSTLTFDVPAIFKDLDYDLVVRYQQQPNHPNPWDNAKIELIRIDGAPDPNGKCNETNDGPTQFSMPNNQRHTIVGNPVCLEEGQRYQIKLTFDQYDPNTPDPKSNILIDSIALIPRTESLEIFEGSPMAEQKREEYENYRCRDLFLAVPTPEIPEECRALLNSISYYTFEGGYNKPCECDNTGSESTLCDKYTGRCPCKKNVVGRRCDRCAPGTFGFGASGCQPCNCHNVGSLDPFCRETDGQCNCAEKAYGRRCNECQPGFWNFPNCQPCQCNGHADICEAQTGQCINCRDATDGPECGVCLEGYYGDPTLEANIPCRECPCPNTKASGHSFAERCFLDTTNNEPVCECDLGYSGARCDVCSDNYYGNPEIPGGSCVSCNCSENWNFQDTGNCDSSSGQCLKCLFNTEGDHCEYCQAGFFGDAVQGQCEACICNILGTDPNRFDCDRFTGECHCLPNVEGRECDRCRENHWKLASGEGCEHCDCDFVGSTSETCNVFDGQCACKPGFGGRRCDQCEENYWGDPRVECYDCNCNPQGSQSFQCDHQTGKCVCLEGIGGEKCDECARGFVQEMALTSDHPVLDRKIPFTDLPRCVECGECFTNWDRILLGLQNQTRDQVQRAEQVKITGVTGAYTRDFVDMEDTLREVKGILTSASVSNDELIGVQADIDRINVALQGTNQNMEELDNNLSNLQQSILQGSSSLDFLRKEADTLKLNAQDMKEQITSLQEANVEGALNLTRQAKRRSDEAAVQVRGIETEGGLLANSEKQRKATETLMNTSKDQFTSTQEQNQQKLNDILVQIDNLEAKIPDLNRQICDGDTGADQPCDTLCGGAGCGKCGGISCLNGALSKAEEAVSSAKAADEVFSEKDREAERVLRDITKTHQNALGAVQEAQRAFDLANEAKNRSVGETTRVDSLVDSINVYTSGDKASPEDVQKLADECLAAEMDLDSSEISGLAQEINSAIDSVTNVDQILAETADDLNRAQELQRRADFTKQNAEEQLKHAEEVTNFLSQAVEAQNMADISIQSAQEDIDSARKDLSQIASGMDEAIRSVDQSLMDVQDLARRQQSLQTSFIRNAKRVNASRDAATKAKNQASEDNTELYNLNLEFKNVSGSLDAKTNSIGSAKDLAVDLQRRASELATSASNKLTNIQDVEKEFEETERRLQELSSELMALNCEMNIHLQVIEDKSNYYRTCSPPSTWSPSATCVCRPGALEPSCNSRRAIYER
eukprot:TCALIF_08711-PA protein Name:"Similar to LanB1 Laminin subunit beta-1 (Drosophila melanogaster)" AED:0.08 eAED:0.08 QI:0/0.86/0.81/1/0.86/0.87/16/623/1807